MKKLSAHGFTLIELMVVMAVIAILATIALFGISRAQAAARDTQRQQIMNGVRTALERYYGDNQTYPYNSTFGNMMGALVPAYMAAPVDPGCGTAKTSWSASGSNWAPCGPTGAVTYIYENPNGVNCTGQAIPAGYQLRLVKEGGGASYFCSPQ